MAGILAELIHLATNSPAMAVEEPLLKGIKALVRASDDNVEAAIELLMDRLGKNHSQVRYLALLIIDELFSRSKLFRNLLVSVFENFLLLSLGYRAEHSLPPPFDRAAMLKAKALEVVEKWNDMFGPHYKQLRLGYEYLKTTLRLNFPGVREAATQAEEQRNAREKRTQELLTSRLLQLTQNFPELNKDIQSTIDQVEECFAILRDRESQAIDTDFAEGEEEFEEYGVRSLRLTRDHEELVPQESQDTAAIFDILRDLFKLLTTRHVPATQEWLSVLMRVDPENRQSRDAMLKEVIDLRNRLLSLRSRCEELGLELVHKATNEAADGQEDVEWEDEQVVVDSKASGSSQAELHLQVVPNSSSSPAITNTLEEKETPNCLRQKLMKEAPVLSWGSFLDGWGSDAGVPANSRGLVLDNHWGRVDPDALIPPERIAEMQVRASYYQPQNAEIRPCLAPLRKGGLCQRKDLHRCPLHGVVIPRDEHGNPIEQVSDKGKRKAAASSSSDWPSSAALAAQAVRNVREGDEAQVRKKLLARRSQIKKDKQHNEAVLRTAALGHSSQGIEESLQRIEVPKKRKGGGLTAMLHKKPTAKDRIAKRLLTGRAVDGAATQTARNEDAKYRESFPINGETRDFSSRAV